MHLDPLFGSALRRRRASMSVTLQQLSQKSGVSASYLGRVESGQRFPSARVLKVIAKPLGFDEYELQTLAGYLSTPGESETEKPAPSRLDPYVARVLSYEPLAVQRAAITILAAIKAVAESAASDSQTVSG